ncbi:MAG: TetR family transcriptional regulator [Gammaproteobacteria bacterium]|nr:MAG: TetR family transcriptional regulator [Gammaproteobacteria bacterium]
MSATWPDTMSFKSFSQRVNLTKSSFYGELYAMHDFSIRNQRIAVKNLQTICESTFLLANELGFQAMTLRQLSRQTGMSMGGLYAYIKSKDDLAELIYSFLNRYCVEVISDLIKDNLSADKTLVALIHSHLYLSELLQPWFYFAYMETKNLSKAHKRVAINSELSMEILLFETIKKGLDDTDFIIKPSSDEKAQLIASLIKAMLQDWYLKSWKYKKRKISVDNYADMVVDMSLGYLKRG